MNVSDRTEHIEIRKRLRGITSVAEFERLLNSRMITDIDKEILKMHYIEGKTLSYIGDMLGYSESYVKKRHRYILRRLF